VTLTHLGHDSATVRPLTAGYRVPGEVIDLANRLLPHIAVGVPPGTAVRAGQSALQFAAASTLTTAVAELLAIEGSIGVIVPDVRAEAVLAELQAAGIDAATLESETDPRIAVVPATTAKGLEFDSVVLLEPAEIVDGEPTRPAGLRRLYVVLTRAVSHLRVLHDQPLPPELA
jgi:DNA helicase IV